MGASRGHGVRESGGGNRDVPAPISSGAEMRSSWPGLGSLHVWLSAGLVTRLGPTRCLSSSQGHDKGSSGRGIHGVWAAYTHIPGMHSTRTGDPRPRPPAPLPLPWDALSDQASAIFPREKVSPYHNRRHLQDLVHVLQRQGHIPQGGLIGQLLGTFRENHMSDGLGREQGAWAHSRRGGNLTTSGPQLPTRKAFRLEVQAWALSLGEAVDAPAWGASPEAAGETLDHMA